MIGSLSSASVVTLKLYLLFTLSCCSRVFHSFSRFLSLTISSLVLVVFPRSALCTSFSLSVCPLLLLSCQDPLVPTTNPSAMRLRVTQPRLALEVYLPLKFPFPARASSSLSCHTCRREGSKATGQ